MPLDPNDPTTVERLAHLAEVDEWRLARIAELAARREERSILDDDLKGWANVRACLRYWPTAILLFGCVGLLSLTAYYLALEVLK